MGDNDSGVVSGTIHVLNSSCYSFSTDVPVSGNISTAGAITLISSAISGQTIEVSGSITSGILTSGSYTITGGCADGDNGTVTGFSTPSYSHTYTGGFVNAAPPETAVKIVAEQYGPDSDGLYHVSGTATFIDSPCFAGGTISNSAMAGSYLAVQITTTNGNIVFAGYLSDSTGREIIGAYQVISGRCMGSSGFGSIGY
jgi:hypothetical protein